MALGLGGGDVYFAHPESGAPTLAIVGAHASASASAPDTAPTEHPRGTRRERREPRGFNINAARFDPKGLRPERLAERLGGERPGVSPSVFSLPADLFGEFAEEEKPGSGAPPPFSAHFSTERPTAAPRVRGAERARRAALGVVQPAGGVLQTGCGAVPREPPLLGRPRRPRRRRRQPVGRGDGSRGERVGTRYWGSQEPAVELHVGAGRVTRPARRKPRENPARADSAFDASPPDLPPLTTNQYRGGGRTGGLIIPWTPARARLR